MLAWIKGGGRGVQALCDFYIFVKKIVLLLKID